MDGRTFLFAKAIRLSFTSKKKDHGIQAIHNYGS